MYNFSGLIYRIWAVAGVLFVVGIVCVLLSKQPKKRLEIRNCKTGLVLIIIAICLGALYLYRVMFPDIASYTGEFVDYYRDSSAAPPLPFTNSYVFWNGEGTKKVCHLDTFSRKEMCPDGFVTGQEYTIYYDTFTDVIVGIELTE